MSLDNKLYFKVVLAGEAGVGKTSLRRSYLGVGFQTQHLSTIGADFASYSTKINEQRVNFQIWDLAGQDIFESMRNLYYKGSLGALMVFDVTDISSLEALNNWIIELEKNSGRGIVPFSILGNKVDLLDEEELNKIRKNVNSVLKKYNKKFVSKGFSINYFETSAKTGHNVKIAFNNLGESIFNYLEFRRKKREES